jgi:hypothetical protein
VKLRGEFSPEFGRQNRLSGGSHPGRQCFCGTSSEIPNRTANCDMGNVARGREAKSLQSVRSAYFDCP